MYKLTITDINQSVTTCEFPSYESLKKYFELHLLYRGNSEAYRRWLIGEKHFIINAPTGPEMWSVRKRRSSSCVTENTSVERVESVAIMQAEAVSVSKAAV